jgi:UDP-N-acetylglucosamine acyltransferase
VETPSQARIHPTAVVATGSKIGQGVVVGPFAVIEDVVEIGAGTSIGPHAVVHRFARIGQNNRIHAHAVIADEPQDLSFSGEETWVEIGDDNVLREGVTIHRSTNAAIPTLIGSGCYLMAYSHAGHECQLGDGVILTNNVMLAGHVEVGERAIIAGGAAVHQFCRVGSLAMVSGLAGVLKDVLPYSIVMGAPARHYRLNTVGLRRAGITGERYQALEQAFRSLRSQQSLDGLKDTPEIEHLRNWLRARSRRGLTAFAAPGEIRGD